MGLKSNFLKARLKRREVMEENIAAKQKPCLQFTPDVKRRSIFLCLSVAAFCNYVFALFWDALLKEEMRGRKLNSLPM